jgi:putative methionine-R-sulfoxide reductase with GAF domain
MFSMLNKGIVSEEKPKPVLDEQTLAKLLEAAYVLQEHNREVQEMELGLDLKRDEAEARDKTELPAPIQPARNRDSATSGDYTFTLAQIVATQHQIQIRNLQLDEAMALVTERLLEMARADGAAIGMVEGRKVRYRAAAGARTLALGTEVASERALCLPCIKNGQVFRCPDVNPEFLVDTEECRRRGIQSLIAVPIFHEGGVVAGLELYYSMPNGFTDQDVHTCQLMAGLITEALAREEEVTWKQSLASERAMMLEALEKLKPNLAALVEPAPVKSAAVTPKLAPVRQVAADTYFCGNCGHEMTVGERFCGQCGTPRAGNETPAIAPIALPQQSMSQSAFSAHSQPVPDPRHAAVTGMRPDESLVESLAEEFPDLFKDPELGGESTSTATQSAEPLVNSQAPSELSLHLKEELETAGDSTVPEIASEHELADRKDTTLEGTEEQETALAAAAPNADWSSAQSAREFLEQVAAGKQRSGLGRFWDTRRGDIYLAIAVILVACVIRWGIWSNHSVGATATPAPTGASAPHNAPDADLSMFDRMLISLGLADAPQVPEDKGNSSTQVWVDLHTALYYCPGADAYGKGAKGKFMTQRDAQLDSYEPAYRKACN